MAAFPVAPMLLFPGPRRQRAPGVVRTQMESGPPKQLKTQSRVMIDREVVYLLKTLADYNAFITFFETTINRGADWFNWTDPVELNQSAPRLIVVSKNVM